MTRPALRAIPAAAHAAPGRLAGLLPLPTSRPLPLAARWRRRRPARRAAPPAAALPLQQLAAAAVGAAARLPALVHEASVPLHAALDPGVLGATVGSCFKLTLICAGVGWMLRTQRIPNSTATVLSQLSFQLLIPCMLFASVAETVASQADLALVAGVALCTAIQVALGALFGLALSPLVDGQYSRDRKLFGWHPLQPAPSAEAIAAGTAAAIGVPAASAALLPRARPPPTGLRQMVALACTFGNSFTLPSVFFLTMLPPALSRPAISYAALFLLAWSPCIWSLGPAMLERGAAPPPAPPPPPPPSAQQQRRQQQQQPAADAGGGDGEQAGEQPAAPRRHLAIFDQLIPHGAAQRLRRFAGQVVNPPFLAIVAGLAVGLTPLGRGLFAPGGAAAGSGAAAAAAALPPELSLARAAVKAAVEVVRLLAESATPIGTIVLASSLLQRPEGGAAGAGAPPAVAPPPPARRRRGWLGAAAALLLPADGVEARALAVIALARFLLLPLATLSTMRLLGAAGLLPGGAAADPLLLLVLLVQAVMPSAQNLIVLLQLSPATQPLAPAFSRLLLKLYAYAALPVSLWVTGFCTGLAIPVVR